MFDGRHCNKKDLEKLVKETDKIVSLLSQNTKNSEKNEELQSFLAFLRRFDVQIADELSQRISSLNDDYGKIINIVKTSVEELKQNVVVDIYEHQ